VHLSWFDSLLAEHYNQRHQLARGSVREKTEQPNVPATVERIALLSLEYYEVPPASSREDKLENIVYVYGLENLVARIQQVAILVMW